MERCAHASRRAGSHDAQMSRRAAAVAAYLFPTIGRKTEDDVDRAGTATPSRRAALNVHCASASMPHAFERRLCLEDLHFLDRTVRRRRAPRPGPVLRLVNSAGAAASPSSTGTPRLLLVRQRFWHLAERRPSQDRRTKHANQRHLALHGHACGTAERAGWPALLPRENRRPSPRPQALGERRRGSQRLHPSHAARVAHRQLEHTSPPPITRRGSRRHGASRDNVRRSIQLARRQAQPDQTETDETQQLRASTSSRRLAGAS